MVVGLFIIGCFISISMGTSMGTITALAPIALGVSQQTSFPVSICVGAVVCGAMFGDNLSFISDTTIAAVRTQGCKMNVNQTEFLYRTAGSYRDDHHLLPYNTPSELHGRSRRLQLLRSDPLSGGPDRRTDRI